MENYLQIFKLGIAKKLKTIRINCGYTQKELAKASNLNIGTISSYERAKSSMNLDVIGKIVDACNYDGVIFFKEIYENIHRQL